MSDTSLAKTVAEGIMFVNWKVGLFVFLFGIFVMSDMFVDTVLFRISGSLEGTKPNSKGTTIQVLIIAIGYMLFDILSRNEVI
jgi:hypothetical protein